MHVPLLGRGCCTGKAFYHFTFFLLFQSASLRPITTTEGKIFQFYIIRSGLGLKQLRTDELLVITHMCTYYLSTFNFLLSRKWRSNVKIFIFLKVKQIHISSAFSTVEFWSDETIKAKNLGGQYWHNHVLTSVPLFSWFYVHLQKSLLALCDSDLFFLL